MKSRVFWLLAFLFSSLPVFAQSWTAKLDKDVRFYQPTEMGVVIAGTEKSLYAIDASNGEVLWRRKDTALDETDVAPVPGTDLVLLSFEKGDKARIEAVDVLTGNSIWRSEKIKGAVMQISVDPATNLLAVVLVKDVKNRARDGFKRRPLLHVLDLATGDELWKYEAGEVEMMPARWPEDSGKEVDYTLDNYYPPAFIDNRLYVFYEGVTSFEARSGKERLREKYRVNEDGLALTEAEPIFTESSILRLWSRTRACHLTPDRRYRVGSERSRAHAGDDSRRRHSLRAHGWPVHSTQRWRDDRARFVWRERDRYQLRQSFVALQRRGQRNHQPSASQSKHDRDCRS